MPRSPLAVRTSAVLASLTLAACADQVVTSPASPSGVKLPGSASAVPARYAVIFAQGATRSLSAAAVAAAGGTLSGAVPVANALIVDHVRNPSVLAAAAGVVRVVEDPDVTLEPTTPDGVAINASGAGASGASPDAAGPVQGASAPWLVSGVQWDLGRMQVPSAWNASSAQGSGARVCIIDTGADTKHQELAGQFVDSTSFVPNSGTDADSSKGFSAPTLDSAGHGSHVSGTVGAKGVVMAGVAPKASLMIAKVFGATGGASFAHISNAIAWCTDHQADVISMSLGLLYYRAALSNPDFVYERTAIDYANAHGVVVVASAGNDNVYQPNAGILTTPAFYPGVVSVGATGPFSKYPLVNGGPPNYNPMDANAVWRNADSRAYYSNFGPIVTVFAPGGNLSASLNMPYRIVNGVLQGSVFDGIFSVCASGSGQTGYQNANGTIGSSMVSCDNSSTYVSYQGTSMAAPHVSGLMALVTAEIGGARTAARRARVISCVTKSTDNIGPSSIYGGGRVNAASAIALVQSGGC